MSAFFRELFRNSLVYGIGATASQLVGLFLLPLYTRFLTPGSYGFLEILLTTASVLTAVMPLGMQNALLRFSLESGDEDQRRRVLSTATIFVACATAACLAALAANAALLSRHLLDGAEDRLVLFVTLGYSGLAAMQYVAMAILRVYNKPGQYAGVSVLGVLVRTILSIAFVAALRLGLHGVLWATTLAALVTAGMAFCLVRDHLAPTFDWSLCRAMLRYGLPWVPAGLSILVISLSDRYFLIAFASPSELGLYAVGARLASIVALAIGAFRLAWPQAALSILHSQDRDALYSRSLTYFVLVGSVLTLGLSLFGNLLLRIMTVPAYYSASKVIPVLSLGLVLNGCASILTIGRIVTKRMAVQVAVTGIPAGVNLILNYYLVPAFGMMGAAWATLASFALMAFLSWWASERVLHVEYEWRRIARLLVPMVVLVVIGNSVSFTAAVYDSLFRASIFLTYFALLWLLKWPNMQERRHLARLADRLCACARGVR